MSTSIPPVVTIIDVPTSHSSPLGRILRSSSPPLQPFPQPVSKRAQEPDETHLRLLPRLRAALASLPPSSTFHAPRRVSTPPPHELDFHTNLSFLSPPLSTSACAIHLDSVATVLDDVSDIYLVPVVNPHGVWTTLTLRHPAPAKTFHVPPRSSFYVGPVERSSLPSLLGPRELVVLDPPWPNRSARRAKRYRTADRFDIVELLLGLQLQHVLVDGGLAAVWITNKPAVRRWLRRVLDAWGCREVAEWVWIKVTASGEPVVALDGETAGARRPYEVLVVARKGGATGGTTIPDRVLVGVPDLHSRKPCVKALLEEALPPRYRAAEVFGRALTEGWYTVGDEAIRWNWAGHWDERGESGGVAAPG